MRERLRVLRHSHFRNLWFAQTTSAMGDGVVIVALALFVTDLTDSPTDVGIVLGAQMLPFVGFLLIGGVWADRLPRQRVIMTADIVRATLHGLLALLIFTDAVEIWHLVVIEALFGTAQAFFDPAYTGLMPRTVPPEEIQEAQALSSLTFNLSELTGPAIATGLVLGTRRRMGVPARRRDVRGQRHLRRARARDPTRRRPASERRSLLVELGEGFREVRTRSWLWVTVVVFALAVPLGYAPLYVLGPTVAEETYNAPGGVRPGHRRVRCRGAARRHHRLPLAAALSHARRLPDDRRLAGDDRVVRPRRAAGARGRRSRSRPESASRSSTCSGTRPWRSRSRRTPCRVRAPTSGWAR